MSNAALSFLLLLSLAAPSFGQDGVDGAPPAEPVLEEPSSEPLPTPTSAEQAVELTDELAGLEGRSVEELRALLAQWLGFAREQEALLETALRQPPGTPAHEASVALRADLDTLLSGAETVAGLLTASGEDVSREQAAIAATRTAGQGAVAASTVPATRALAIALPVEVLKAQLRPLTRAQVAEQLEQWIAFLQQASLQVRTFEVSSILEEDPDKVEASTARAVELRGERSALIKRVQAVIAALERKGGDVEEARAYVSSVVAKPQITGLRAGWATMRAWLLDTEGGIAMGKSLATALGILIAFWVLSKLVRRVIARATGRMQRSSQLLQEFLVDSATRLTILIGLLIAFSTLGVNMTPLVAAIGAAGLVIGLALQGTLGNLASGIMIMIYRPFDVADVVQTAGAVGKVDGMTLMTTTIKTFDNQTVHVPNNMIWGDVITNVTANATRRVDMVFGISYSDDIALAKRLIGEVLGRHPLVLADPAPNIRVSALADSSVNIIARPWSATEDYWEVFWSVTEEVKGVFDANDVSIPFPQRDVHLIPAGGAADVGAASEVGTSA